MRGKKILLAFSLLAVFASCDHKPFRGFLVCKEYVPGHMDNEQPNAQQEAYLHVPIIIMRRHEPEYVPPVWYFFVANKYDVRRFRVDSLTYTRHKVGERIIMNLK